MCSIMAKFKIISCSKRSFSVIRLVHTHTHTHTHTQTHTQTTHTGTHTHEQPTQVHTHKNKQTKTAHLQQHIKTIMLSKTVNWPWKLAPNRVNQTLSQHSWPWLLQRTQPEHTSSPQHRPQPPAPVSCKVWHFHFTVPVLVIFSSVSIVVMQSGFQWGVSTHIPSLALQCDPHLVYV